MPYRVAPPRDPEPPAKPSHVIAFRRYGWIWVGAMTAIAVGMGALGLVTYSRTVLSCARPSTGGEAECALVVERVTGASREPVTARAYSVKVQDALLGDEGMKPHLGVHPSSGGVRWFQLRGRNHAVERSFAAFLASPEARRYEEELDISRAGPIGLPLGGLLMIALVLALEAKQRIEVHSETGELRISKQGLFGRPSERVFQMDEIDEVDTEQEGDGEIYAVVFVQGERRERIATGSHGRAEAAAKELRALLKSRRRQIEAREKEEKARREAEKKARQDAADRAQREAAERAHAEQREAGERVKQERAAAKRKKKR